VKGAWFSVVLAAVHFGCGGCGSPEPETCGDAPIEHAVGAIAVAPENDDYSTSMAAALRGAQEADVLGLEETGRLLAAAGVDLLLSPRSDKLATLRARGIDLYVECGPGLVLDGSDPVVVTVVYSTVTGDAVFCSVSEACRTESAIDGFEATSEACALAAAEIAEWLESSGEPDGE